MQPEQRARFVSNIRNEANRIQALVDRMLELSALENQKILKKIEQISVSTLFQTVYESKRAILKKKAASPDNPGSRKHPVEGR
jgi:two-component system sensor histidine kinase CreC